VATRTGSTNDHIMAPEGYTSVSFNKTTASHSIDPVTPEPGSPALLASAMGLFALMSRRTVRRLSPARRWPSSRNF